MRAKKNSVYSKLAQHTETVVSKRHQDEQIDVAAAVRNLRQQKGLSGVLLCRRAGDLDPKTLTALEKGRIKNPSIKTLQSVARGLGVTVSHLFRSIEEGFESNFALGTPKGAFTLDFGKKGSKIISYTPLIRDFFCGKLILAPRTHMSETLLNHPVPIYLSTLVGRVEITVESGKSLLREGESIFFNGALSHAFYNPLHRESSLLMVMAPSFLK